MECHGPSAAPSGRSALELEDRTERVPLSSPALRGEGRTQGARDADTAGIFD